eukprot:g2391.t1
MRPSRERAVSAKAKEKQEHTQAFTSFPDFSKLNDGCHNGVKEDTFCTVRPSSRSGEAAGASLPWALVACILRFAPMGRPPRQRPPFQEENR